MSSFPDTRQSLLERVRAAGSEGERDDVAWREFAAVYGPAVYRLARHGGLQHADAEDLVQGVFTAVHRAIAGWQADPARGRFRAWLATVTRNAAMNALTRRPRDAGSGRTSVIAFLADIPEPEARAAGALQREFRRGLFRLAAEQVRSEVGDDQWAAFELTAVKGRSADEAAATLGRSAGAVYASRSRVMRRLREAVARLETEFADSDVESPLSREGRSRVEQAP